MVEIGLSGSFNRTGWSFFSFLMNNPKELEFRTFYVCWYGAGLAMISCGEVCKNLSITWWRRLLLTLRGATRILVVKWKDIAKNKRIKFVYIRATHGKGYADRHYRRNASWEDGRDDSCRIAYRCLLTWWRNTMASILSSIATRASIIRRWGRSSIAIISSSPIITPDNPLSTAEESAISGSIQKPDICMVLEKG